MPKEQLTKEESEEKFFKELNERFEIEPAKFLSWAMIKTGIMCVETGSEEISFSTRIESNGEEYEVKTVTTISQ